jgi:AAA domain
MNTPRYLVLSGLPASGKSTLAAPLARALGLRLLDKDFFLEALFEGRGIGDGRWRRELSQQADASLRECAEHSAGAVLCSWWRHPRSPQADSGTPCEWLGGLPGVTLELHCRCSPQLATERFLARRRHPGHLDGRHSYVELLAGFTQQAALGPLGLSPLLEIDTETPPDCARLLAAIGHAFEPNTMHAPS